MTVAREAELERQRAQVAIVLGQPLERRAQAQRLPVPGEREARLGAEDAGEVERRGVELPGELGERPPHGEIGGDLGLGRLRELAVVCARPLAAGSSPSDLRLEHRQHEPGGQLLGLELVARVGRGAGGRAGAGAGRCACRPGRGSPGGGLPRRAVRAFPPPARRTPTRRRARGGAPAGSAGRRCRASRGSASPARARGPPAGSAPSAAERRRARGRRSGSSRATTGRPAGSGTRRPRASASRAAGSRWPHHAVTPPRTTRLARRLRMGEGAAPQGGAQCLRSLFPATM